MTTRRRRRPPPAAACVPAAAAFCAAARMPAQGCRSPAAPTVALLHHPGSNGRRQTPRRSSPACAQALPARVDHHSTCACLLLREPHTARAPRPGIGPEIAEAVQKIFEAAEAPIAWDVQHIGKEVDPRTNSFVTRENLDSVLVRRRRRRRSCWAFKPPRHALSTAAL